MPVLRVVSPDALREEETRVNAERVAAEDRQRDESQLTSSLVAFIDNQFNIFVRHRDGANGWSDRLVAALRTFNGQYDATKLAEIRQFGGSEIYARLIATKCRGATSLLRDVYLNTEKPWGLEATPDPTLPEDIARRRQPARRRPRSATHARLGQPPDAEMIRDRITALIAGRQARRDQERQDRGRAVRSRSSMTSSSRASSTKRSAQCLVDLPLFPFCCLKGPVVRITPQVTWVNGKAQVINKPKMFWNRVSPFDVWWTPGVSNIADAAVIERSRLTRSDLNQLIGLPGYNDAAILEVLKWYGQSGYVEARPRPPRRRGPAWRAAKTRA